MYQNLLFDLDGTLTNSAEGITKCVQYALKHMGIDEPDLTKLYKFIGPPLRASFENYYGLTAEQAEAATAKYRERFHNIGMYENELYPGIPELLQYLTNCSATLAMATAKPQVYAIPIAEHFNMAHYFKAMVGSSLDGKLDNKALVIAEALRQLGAETAETRAKTIMIGDRRDDVIAAHANNIKCIGIGYGFGSYEELTSAGADYYAATITDLQKLLTELIKK